MDSAIVRRAAPVDESAIVGMVSGVERAVVRSWGDEMPRALRTGDFILVSRDGRLGCVLGSFIGPETVAQIQVCALRDGWSTSEALAVLLPGVRQALQEKGVAELVFVGSEEWMLKGLLANGFRRVNTILTLQKAGASVPDRGNPRVVVRPAQRSDFADILAIDKAAFRPLWQNTMSTLEDYLRDLPFFCVAELDGRVVGYEYASQIGRHGHLARVAISPGYRGQRIGVRLLAEVMDFYRRRGVFGVTLNTQRDNERAMRLYAWFGFKPLGTEAEVLAFPV